MAAKGKTAEVIWVGRLVDNGNFGERISFSLLLIASCCYTERASVMKTRVRTLALLETLRQDRV